MRALFRWLSTVIFYLPSFQALPEELDILISGSVNSTGVIQEIANRFINDNPGITIKIQVGGSLKVHSMAREGAADLAISHYPVGEEFLMRQGYGVIKASFMYNKFAIFGPKDDSLNIAANPSLKSALISLKDNEVDFYVPSNLSGAKMKLDQIWRLLDIKPDWIGYEVSGQSGPSTLKAANDLGYYTFVDMGSYVKQKDKIDNLIPLFRDDALLDNFYTAIVLDQNRLNRNGQALAEKFFDFITSDKIQKFISLYGYRKFGVNLYIPYAAFDETVINRKIAAELASTKLSLYILFGMLVIVIASLIFAYTNLKLRKISDIHANNDNLTGIGNRRLFTQETGNLIREEKGFTLLMLDLVGFKGINDTHGHEYGDAVLIIISERISELLMRSGKVYRLGGDEFVINLYGLYTEDSELLSSIIRAITREIDYNDIRLSVNASIGIAYYPTDAVKLNTLLKMADKAMYQSKQEKRTYTRYSEAAS